MKKDLLSIDDLTADEIYLILDTTEAMREIGQRPIKKVPTLRGKTVVNLFYEPSTRTRTSFEIAEKRLSADTLNIAVASSSVLKGETLVDTVLNIEAMAPDMIVMRHASSGAGHLLTRICRSRIINAGDGMHEHPTQALLDDTAIARALTRIAHEILERNEDASQLYLVAIPTGGVPLARRLAASLRQIAEVEVPVGVLDTTLYRDDRLTRGIRPKLRKTEMPSAVDERLVILVDDVASTGRTIRAAMDALMDFGRPRAVQVVALVDRGHRELPIKADYVGKNLPTAPSESVQVHLTEIDGKDEVEIQG